MDSPADFTGPVNLGNPGEFTIRALAEKVLEMTGSRSRLEFRPLPADDPKQRQPDITLAKSRLGWSPIVTLDKGLPPAIDHFRYFPDEGKCPIGDPTLTHYRRQ